MLNMDKYTAACTARGDRKMQNLKHADYILIMLCV